MTIFILDEIVVKPGLVRDYREAYRQRYVPGAEQRGMTLEQAWQSPPGMDFDGLPMTLYYLWSVPDTASWWKMRMSKTPDGRDERFDKLAWWEESEAMTLGRKRTTLSPQPDAS